MPEYSTFHAGDSNTMSFLASGLWTTVTLPLPQPRLDILNMNRSSRSSPSDQNMVGFVALVINDNIMI